MVELEAAALRSAGAPLVSWLDRSAPSASALSRVGERRPLVDVDSPIARLAHPPARRSTLRAGCYQAHLSPWCWRGTVCSRARQHARARSSLPFFLPTPSAAARALLGRVPALRPVADRYEDRGARAAASAVARHTPLAGALRGVAQAAVLLHHHQLIKTKPESGEACAALTMT